MTATPESGPPPGGRLYPDDDLYRIHSRWLGPKGYTLPFQVPFRAVPVALGAFVAALTLLRGAGASGPFLYMAAGAAAFAVAALAVRATGPERPLAALAAIVWHEASAPRPEPADAERAVLRPGLVPARPAVTPPTSESRHQ